MTRVTASSGALARQGSPSRNAKRCDARENTWRANLRALLVHVALSAYIFAFCISVATLVRQGFSQIFKRMSHRLASFLRSRFNEPSSFLRPRNKTLVNPLLPQWNFFSGPVSPNEGSSTYEGGKGFGSIFIDVVVACSVVEFFKSPFATSEFVDLSTISNAVTSLDPSNYLRFQLR